jgi:DNA-binding response OmpR family regulator
MKKAAFLIDDKETALIVRTALECAGFVCETHATMLTLLRSTRRDELDAILVDTSKPDVDCSELLSWRRDWLGASVALLALGPNDGTSAANSLALGVDDFVSLPVRATELLARVATALRRCKPQKTRGRLSIGGCSLDRESCALVSASARVSLTQREFALAQILFEHAGQLVTRARLARDVWGQPEEISGRVIEQHVYQLRRKLKRCCSEALALRGVYGSGYRIDAGAVAQPEEALLAPQVEASPWARRKMDFNAAFLAT